MVRAILTRTAASLAVVFGSLALVFVIVYLLPGDPVYMILDPAFATPEVIENLRRQLGTDQPLHVQFARYASDMLRGEFGRSIVNGDPVLPKIIGHFPVTAALAACSAVFASLFGIWLGVLSAVHRNGWIDYTARAIGLFGISMPTFWTGILLILLFSVRLGWFPAMGSDGWKTLVLPSLALGLVASGFIIRLVRNSMLETLGEPFILTLRAKGLAERAVLYRHALRNALLPALTMIGVLAGDLMAGSVVIETVFSRQGIGRIVSDALMAKDVPVIQGVMLFTAILYVLVNLLVDLSYSLVDPRVRRLKTRR